MKRKLMAIALALMLALSMTAFAVTAFADEKTPNDEITAVDYENAAGAYGMAFMAKGFSVAGSYWASIGMENYVVYTKADSSVVSGITVESCGTQVAIGRNQNIVPATGDSIRFKAGFEYGACYLGEDAVFIYNGTSFVKQLPESAISEITVTAIGYNESWGGPTVQFEVSIADAGAYGMYASGDKAHLSYVNAYGEAKPLADCTYIGSKNFITRLAEDLNMTNKYNPMVGDIFTVQKGFMLTQSDKGERVNADCAYIYNGQGFIPYVAETHKVTSFEITNSAENNLVYIDATLQLEYTANEGAIYTPKFTSSAPEIATVSETGVITGVAAGNATITAKVGEIEKTYAVQVKAAPVVTGVQFGTSYDILVPVGATEVKIPEDFTILKVYNDGATSTPIALTSENSRFKTAVDASAVTDTATQATIIVTVDGKEYELTVNVKLVPEITVESVNYVPSGWGAPTIVVKFVLANNAAYGTYAPGDLANLAYINAYGEIKPLADCTYVNDGHFISRLAEAIDPSPVGEYTPMKGDIFTIKQAFTLKSGHNAEGMREEKRYIFDGTSFIPYVPATHDVTSFAIANNEEENTVYIDSLLEIGFTYNEGALFTPKFTSSNEAVATVDADGVVRGLTTGTTVIKAVVGSFESSFTVNVKPAPVVTGVQFKTSYDIVTEKGAEAKIPDNFTVVKIFDDETTSAPIALTAENARFKETVDTSVVPAITGKTLAKIVVTIDDTEYELDIFVRIIEVVDLKFTEAAVVEWFGFATFVEYPNCTTNKANFTSETEIKVADLENYLDHIEYLRDGEKVQFGSYLLGGGNIALFPPRADGGSDPIDIDNFFETMYKQGDLIKLMKGLTVYGHSGVIDANNGTWSNKNGMLYREAVLQEDVMFRFAGTGWSLYVPYTGIEVESEEIEIALGSKNSVVGARRVPSNATSGTFKYVSSDETVLTVSENGKINALKVGEAIITVTLSGEESVGDKVATVKVKVTNKIVSLKITEKLILEPGTTEIDLSKVKGVYEYGDGSTEEATDLANAMVVGFDPEEKGEQVLTIRVKHNGVNYTANLIVEIREKTEESSGSNGGKKGCGSSAAGSAGLCVLAAAMVVLIGKKKR